MNGHARLLPILTAAAALLVAALVTAPAQAKLSLRSFDIAFAKEDGTPVTQAGSHPFAMTTRVGVEYSEEAPGEFFPEEELKDLIAELLPGLTGNATLPQCPMADYLESAVSGNVGCSDDTVVGVAAQSVLEPPNWEGSPIWNLEPPPGVAARLVFRVLSVSAFVDVALKEGGDYNIVADAVNVPQIVHVFGSVVQLWGTPTDPGHNNLRGGCAPKFIFFEGDAPEFEFPQDADSCPVSALAPKTPLLTLPTSCAGPATTVFHADSWQTPAARLANGEADLSDQNWLSGSVLTHDDATPPNPEGFTGCGKLGFSPTIESRTSTDSAETGSGLDFSLDFDQKGLINPDGEAQSAIKKAVVTLPEGITINPSIGEGLGVCTPADLGRETLAAAPGEGCPNASKIGTVHLETPIVGEAVDGSVFLAQQDDPATPQPGAENPFDALIAFYIVLKNPNLGVLIKLPARVEPDPLTGQLVTTVENIPQQPFSHFLFHFREGQRAPLVSPASCGSYLTKAELTPWARPDEVLTKTASLQITRGIGGGPCPAGGVPSFNPGFEAGSVNNNAGSFSPFDMRLTRNDGDQDMTKFSSILPPACSARSSEWANAPTGRSPLPRRRLAARSWRRRAAPAAR